MYRLFQSISAVSAVEIAYKKRCIKRADCCVLIRVPRKLDTINLELLSKQTEWIDFLYYG